MRAATLTPTGAATAAPSPAPLGAPVALPAGVELRRLGAAAGLTAESIGAGCYLVTGGAEPHHVDLRAEGAALPACDCGDALYRPQYVCKHTLCALAAEGDTEVRAALSVVATLQSIATGALRANARAAALGGMR